MKRHALLIANLDAAGAQNDINNWKKFLCSGIGGAWRTEEIQVLTNPSKDFLETSLIFIYSMCKIRLRPCCIRWSRRLGAHNHFGDKP